MFSLLLVLLKSSKSSELSLYVIAIMGEGIRNRLLETQSSFSKWINRDGVFEML